MRRSEITAGTLYALRERSPDRTFPVAFIEDGAATLYRQTRGSIVLAADQQAEMSPGSARDVPVGAVAARAGAAHGASALVVAAMRPGGLLASWKQGNARPGDGLEWILVTDLTDVTGPWEQATTAETAPAAGSCGNAAGNGTEASRHDTAILAITAIAGPIAIGELVYRWGGAEDELAASRSLTRLSRLGLVDREVGRPPAPGPTGRWLATTAGRSHLTAHRELVADVARRLAVRGFRARGAEAARLRCRRQPRGDCPANAGPARQPTPAPNHAATRPCRPNPRGTPATTRHPQ